MPRHDSYDSECLVFSFKEGLLSRLAHDLKLRVARFSVDIDDAKTSLQATFDPSSLEVLCARIDGTDAPDVLSKSDKRKILANTMEDVLRVRRHPEVRFVSESIQPVDGGDQLDVVGTLHLCGREQSLRTRAVAVDDRWTAEIRLHQPDFGIRPFSAAFGGLKIKPDVVVRLSVPAGANTGDSG